LVFTIRRNAHRDAPQFNGAARGLTEADVRRLLADTEG
jgi:hypothetical protein